MRFTNKHNIPAPLCRAIEWQAQAHSEGKANISCTGLIDSPLVRYLWKVYDDQVVIDYASRLWPLFGTIAHMIVERFHGEGEEHLERKVYAPFGRWLISGQVDYILTPGTLYDYKFTSSYNASEVKIEWERQENVYLSLLRHSENPEDRAIGRAIKELKICAMLRDWGPRMKDKFPCQIKMLDVPVWDTLEGVEPESVPLWEDKQAISYIQERVAIHQEAIEAACIPPQCSEEERWVKPEAYKIMKEGRKSSVKNFLLSDYTDTEAAKKAATDYVNGGGKGVGEASKCDVVLAKSEPRRCIDYCDVSAFCPYYRPEEKGTNEVEEWI